MVKKQGQQNPSIERVYAQFLADIDAHDDVPKETVDKIKSLLESGGKVDLQSIDKIINE